MTGGVYKNRERIHRCVADQRLLTNPPSCRRVAAYNPNWGWVYKICVPSWVSFLLSQPLYYGWRPGCKGHADLTSSSPSSALTRAVSLEVLVWAKLWAKLLAKLCFSKALTFFSFCFVFASFLQAASLCFCLQKRGKNKAKLQAKTKPSFCLQLRCRQKQG